MTSVVAQKAQELEAKDWKSFPRDKGKFVTGHHYGPGRVLGTRNKLTEAFIAALQSDFEKHGPKAIAKVRSQFPAAYVKVIASLLPKDVNLSLSGLDSMTDEQLDRRLQTIKAMIEATADDRKQIVNGEIEEIKPAVSVSSVHSDPVD